jgi:hypothetical protein
MFSLRLPDRRHMLRDFSLGILILLAVPACLEQATFGSDR